MQAKLLSAPVALAFALSFMQPALSQAESPSKAPVTYCEAALSQQRSGFFPYCSPIRTPQFGYSFTLLEAASASSGFTAEWRIEGKRTVPARSSKEEVDMIEAVENRISATQDRQCLGQLLPDCLAALASRMVVTTSITKPFLPLAGRRSFGSAPDSGLAEIQIVLPGEGTRSMAKTAGPGDRSPARDVVGLVLHVRAGLVASIEISGRYPILSSDPLDYEGTGFADFMGSLFPECRGPNEMAFYQAVWQNLVKSAKTLPDNGKWKFTDNGVAKGYTSFADGTLCGFKASSFSGVSRGFTDEWRRSDWAAKTLTIRR